MRPSPNGGEAIAPYWSSACRTVTGKPLYARSPQSFGRIIEAATRRHDETR